MMETTTRDLAAAFRPHFEKAASGGRLSEDEASEAFSCIMQGAVSEIELAGFLVALKARGETVDEIAGAVSAMRALMTPVEAPPGAIDVVGTGGDAKGTYNISTATAFVLAGGGRAGGEARKPGGLVEVGRGRRAGTAWRYDQNASPAHPAVLRARWPRLPVGPSASSRHAPRGAGTPEPEAAHDLQPARPAAQPGRDEAAAHRRLCRAVARAHGRGHEAGGRDPRLGGPWRRRHGRAVNHRRKPRRRVEGRKAYNLRGSPSDAGLPLAALSDLQGGSPEDSAAAMRALLRGERGAFRDIVLLNSAAAFIMAGRAHTLKEGARLAAASIDEGRAENALDALIATAKDQA